MAKWKVYEIIVEGRGEFPLDMLRYDRCYPAGPFDAEKLDNSHRDRRTVFLRFLRQTGQTLSTPDRWASFGWSVMEEREVR